MSDLSTTSSVTKSRKTNAGKKVVAAVEAKAAVGASKGLRNPQPTTKQIIEHAVKLTAAGRKSYVWTTCCAAVNQAFIRKESPLYPPVLAAYKCLMDKINKEELKAGKTDDELKAMSDDERFQYLWRESCLKAKVKQEDTRKGSEGYEKVKALYDTRRQELYASSTPPSTQPDDDAAADEYEVAQHDASDFGDTDPDFLPIEATAVVGSKRVLVEEEDDNDDEQPSQQQ